MGKLNSGAGNTKLESLLVLSTKELTREQKKRRVDLLATILLALAAVLSAFSAYQASRWYSETGISLAESSTLRAEAAKDDRHVNTQMTSDMMLFLEWTDAFRKNDTTLMRALDDRFSESLKKAFPAWLHVRQKGAANLLPKGTPFELQEYSLALQDESNKLIAKSDDKFIVAKKASQLGDKFIFSLVIFSLALFFGAVCTKIELHIAQAFLLWIGIVIMIVGIIVISQLPWNTLS